MCIYGASREKEEKINEDEKKRIGDEPEIITRSESEKLEELSAAKEILEVKQRRAETDDDLHWNSRTYVSKRL